MLMMFSVGGLLVCGCLLPLWLLSHARMCLPIDSVFVTGVDPSFLSSCFTKFYLPTEVDDQFKYHSVLSTKKPDVVRSLYDDAGKSRRRPVCE
jgi:hypothetical protein